MKILIIDNYDSFTYNLYQVIGSLLQNKQETSIIDVYRNDALTLQEIKDRKYDRIVISPGPGNPADKEYFGVCAEVLTEIGKTTPVLGVCLGLQGLAYYFGGQVVKAKLPMHGKTSLINHDEKGVFANLPQGLEVMRYHSLIVDKDSLPSCFKITARSYYGRNKEDYEIMGLRHLEYQIEGIQFHPESFATEGGEKMIANFLFASHD
jgi:anthranilate synthase component 2